MSIERCDGSGYITREGPPPPGFSIGPPESEHCPGCPDCYAALQAKVKRAEKERDEAMRRGAESEHAAQRLERGERADSIFARHDRRVDWPSDVHERPADAIAAALDLQGAKVERLKQRLTPDDGQRLAGIAGCMETYFNDQGQGWNREQIERDIRYLRNLARTALKEASHE